VKGFASGKRKILSRGETIFQSSQDATGFITPATIHLKTILPAEAGKRSLMFIIHDGTGFRVKPGMTTLNMFTCRSNNMIFNGP
jgi:hypothetical protein